MSSRGASNALLSAMIFLSCSHPRAVSPPSDASRDDERREMESKQRGEIDKCVHDRLQQSVAEPMFAGEVDVPALEFMCAWDNASVTLSAGYQERYRCTSFRGFKLPISASITKTRFGTELSTEQLDRRSHLEGAIGCASDRGFPETRWAELVSVLAPPTADSRTKAGSNAPVWFLEHITPNGYSALETSSTEVGVFCSGLLDLAQVDPNQIRRPSFINGPHGPGDVEQW